MRLSKAYISMLPVFAAASANSNSEPVEDVSSNQDTSQSINVQSSTGPLSSEETLLLTSAVEEHSLELRQAITPGAAAAAAATTIAKPPNPVTTEWIPSAVNPTSTPYVAVVYTQTFASVPNQLPSAASGSVGLGTITGQVGIMHTTAAEKENGVNSLGAGMWRWRVVLGFAAAVGYLL